MTSRERVFKEGYLYKVTFKMVDRNRVMDCGGFLCFSRSYRPDHGCAYVLLRSTNIDQAKAELGVAAIATKRCGLGQSADDGARQFVIVEVSSPVEADTNYVTVLAFEPRKDIDAKQS
jgi:hypothetical protein